MWNIALSCSNWCFRINEDWFNGIFLIRRVQNTSFPFFPSMLSRKTIGMNSVEVAGKVVEALLLERILANFIGTSVWLFGKEKKLVLCNLIFFRVVISNIIWLKINILDFNYRSIQCFSGCTCLYTCRGIKIIVLLSCSFLSQFYSIHGRINRENAIINFIVVNALKIGNHLESVIKLPTIIILSTHFLFPCK